MGKRSAEGKNDVSGRYKGPGVVISAGRKLLTGESWASLLPMVVEWFLS